MTRREVTVRTASRDVVYVYEGPDAEHLTLVGVTVAGEHAPLPPVTDGQGRYLDPAAAFPGDLTHLPENSTPEQSQTDRAWHDPAFGGGSPAPPVKGQ